MHDELTQADFDPWLGVARECTAPVGILEIDGESEGDVVFGLGLNEAEGAMDTVGAGVGSRVPEGI